MSKDLEADLTQREVDVAEWKNEENNWLYGLGVLRAGQMKKKAKNISLYRLLNCYSRFPVDRGDTRE